MTLLCFLVTKNEPDKPKWGKARQKISIGHKFEIIMLRESPNYKNLNHRQFCDVVSKLYDRKITPRTLREMFDSKDMIKAAVSLGEFDPYATSRLKKKTKARISQRLSTLPMFGPPK